MKMLNIGIIEDHDLIRLGLKYFLSQQDFISSIWEFTEGNEVLAMMQEHKFETLDLIFMDINLPNIDGLTLTQKIKLQYPKIKIVILSSYQSKTEVQKAFRVGADAYCTKETSNEKLVQIIQEVMGGAIWVDPLVAKYILAIFQEQTDYQDQKDFTHITERELDIIKLIAQGKANQEIANDLFISIHTVKVHIKSILKKLAVEDRTQIAIKALKNKIV